MNVNNREPGFYVEDNNIYLSFRKQNNVTLKPVSDIYSELKIFLVMYHYEEIGVLFVLNDAKFKVLQNHRNHLVIDRSYGEGIVYWSEKASMHSSVSTTVFVMQDLLLEAEK